MVPSDLELMQLQVAALYELDARSRLLRVNEPDGAGAPRLFVGRTASGTLWRFRHDLPDALLREIERLLRAEPVVPDPTRPLACLDELLAALERQAPVTATWSGPAWRFPENLAAPAGVVGIAPDNADLLRPTYPWLAANLPAYQPCFAILQQGAAVSICFSARNSPRAAEAGVQTHDAFRGRGYASSTVAAWASAVRRENRIPLYSTSWDNAASRGVARRLGLVLYGADLSFD
jgi:RimJ/RimL family protein N-acetyltransferase